MEARRWNDDRLDDMHALVNATDKRVDEIEKRHNRLWERLEKVDENQATLSKTGDRRQDHRWQVALVLLASVPSFATLVITLATHLG